MVKQRPRREKLWKRIVRTNTDENLVPSVVSEKGSPDMEDPLLRKRLRSYSVTIPPSYLINEASGMLTSILFLESNSHYLIIEH